MDVPGFLLLDIERCREHNQVPNAMELSSKSNQINCVDTPGNNLSNYMRETKPDDEGNQWIHGEQETSPIAEDLCEKVDSNLAPSDPDTQTSNTLKGELCGLYKQVSIDYVDIFEIIREEILAAEARDLEVGRLLNGSEEYEKSSCVEGDERADVRELTVAAVNGDDYAGDAQNHSFLGKATDVGDVALMHGCLQKGANGQTLQKGENGQIETSCNPSVGLLEDTTLREGEEMHAENYGEVQLKDNRARLEDQLQSAKSREVGVAQKHLVAEDVEHTQPCTAHGEDGTVHDHEPYGTEDEVGFVAQEHLGMEDVECTESFTAHREGGTVQDQPCGADEDGHMAQERLVEEDVEHKELYTAHREEGIMHGHKSCGADAVVHVGLAQDHQDSEQIELVESPTQITSGQAHENGDKVDHEETSTPLNRESNDDTLSKKDEGSAADISYDTLPADKVRGGGEEDKLVLTENSDQLSEHSDNEECSTSSFSGPIAFSGMLSYSGLIPYSGQIPHSGNMSLHSDSSTSTRSFAFPVLASDWTSSPSKIGQPDARYFRQRRRWRPRFCCSRPATLFD